MVRRSFSIDYTCDGREIRRDETNDGREVKNLGSNPEERGGVEWGGGGGGAFFNMLHVRTKTQKRVGWVGDGIERVRGLFFIYCIEYKR